MTDKTPLVSVCMITYNHEAFIAEAIEGVMMQKTDFPIELIIGEDCSTDSTRKICLKFKEKYPDKIRLLLPESNIGMIPNFISTMSEGNAKYIALCEGDDYWTDPYKLQKQVDFLEANHEYGLICSKARVYNQEKNEISGVAGTNIAEKYELLLQGFTDLIAPTVLMRTDLLNKCVSECQFLIERTMFIDTAIWYWFSSNSKIKFIDEITCTYRVLKESASHTADLNKRLSMDTKYYFLKLYFLIKYPIQDRSYVNELTSSMFEDKMQIVKFAQFAGNLETRKSWAYRIGVFLLKPFKSISNIKKHVSYIMI